MKRLILLTILFPAGLLAQLSPEKEAAVDSLKEVIRTAKHDTTIVRSWQAWDNLIYFYNPDLDFELNQKIDSLCQLNLKKNHPLQSQKAFLKYRANALNNLGIIETYNANYELAEQYYLECLEIQTLLLNKVGMGNAYSNLGLITDAQGNYQMSIQHYTKSLKLREEINDLKGISTSLNNMGNIHMALGDYEAAKDHHQRSLEMKLEIDDKQGIAVSYQNLGIIADKEDDLEQSKKYFKLSGQYYAEINDKSGIASNQMSTGIIHMRQQEYAEAMKYFELCLEAYLELGDQKGLSNIYANIGVNYRDQGKYREAKKYLELSLSIAEEINNARDIMNSSAKLVPVYENLGMYKDGLEMHKTYITFRDSIEGIETQQEVFRQELQYTFEKEAAADSIKAAELTKIQDAELIAQKAENKQEKQAKYFSYIGLGIALLFGVFIFNRFKVTQKQKGIIEEQKSQVDLAFGQLEEKNNEILDSINYAKRIQSAILPQPKIFHQHLKNSFVLYKPKDIVAGDFYWLEPTADGVLFAAADCTGHGVPGAMVSVVCNNGLNRSVREKGLTDPAKILDSTREIVIEEFEKSAEEVKDGMDIALCSLGPSRALREPQGDTSGTLLKYAGAHNALWIIRKGATEVEEIKADKQPIGKFHQPVPFTTHEVQLNAGDSIYIFSDGFADQFGGDKGKKFKAKNFKALLLSIQNEVMNRQGELLGDRFEEWKGSLEQLDDLCVIGVRV